MDDNDFVIMDALFAEVKRLNADLQEEDAKEAPEGDETMESKELKAVEEISGYTPDEMIAMYNDYERMAKECEACATLKEQTRWVPVSERLPDMCGLKCLVRATNKFEQTEVFTAFTGYMEHGKLEFHSCERPYDDLSVWKITHWMPLPEAPKEAEEGEAE